MGRCGRTTSTTSECHSLLCHYCSLSHNISVGPLVDSDQGKRLGDEVWREMVDVFEREAPEIKEIVSTT